MEKQCAFENKLCRDQHRLCIRSTPLGADTGRIVLVRGGRSAYLNFHHSNGSIVHLSGTKALRRLALAILAELTRG